MFLIRAVQFLLNLLLALAGSVLIAADRASGSALRMRTLPHDSVPSASFLTTWFYNNSNDSAERNHDFATLEVTASVPSVHLENVSGFVDVKCTKSIATASFTSTSSISKWPTTPTLLLISGLYACGQTATNRFGSLLATSWTIHPNNTVVFQTSDPEANGVTASFKIVAKSFHNIHQKRSLVKRSAVDSDHLIRIAKPFKEAMPAVKPFSRSAPPSPRRPSISKPADLPHAPKPPRRQSPAKVNHARITATESAARTIMESSPPKKSTVRRKRSGYLSTLFEKIIPVQFKKMFRGVVYIPIPATDAAIEGECVECAVATTSAVIYTIEGSLFPFHVGYTVSWDGNLEIDVDLVLDVSSDMTMLMSSPPASIIHVPLTPISIPGILHVGPVFRLRARIDIGFLASSQVSIQLTTWIRDFKASYSSIRGPSLRGPKPFYKSDVVSSQPVNGELDFLVYAELAITATAMGQDVATDTAATRIVVGQRNMFTYSKKEGKCVDSTIDTRSQNIIAGNMLIIPLGEPYKIKRSCSGHEFD